MKGVPPKCHRHLRLGIMASEAAAAGSAAVVIVAAGAQEEGEEEHQNLWEVEETHQPYQDEAFPAAAVVVDERTLLQVVAVALTAPRLGTLERLVDRLQMVVVPPVAFPWLDSLLH